jgi:hypothetical protein
MNTSLRFFRNCFLLILFSTIISSQQSFAGIVRKWVGSSNANGYWSIASSWSPAGIPQAGDKLVFDSTSWPTIYVDVAPPVLGRITVLSGYISLTAYGSGRQIILSSPDTALYISSVPSNGFGLTSGTLGINLSFSGAGNKVVDFGNLYVGNGCTYNATNSNTVIFGRITAGNGQAGSATNIISTAANLSFAAGSVFSNNIGSNPVPTASWDLLSTCTLESQTTTGLGQAFGNFSISGSVSGDFLLKGRLTNIRGNLSISGAYPGTNYSFGTDSAFTMNIGGNLIIPGGNYNNPQHVRFSDGSASPVINVGGSLMKASGSYFQLDFGSGSGSATLNIKGNYVNQGNYIIKSGTGANGIVNFNGTSQQLTCDSSDRINYYVHSGSTVTLTSVTGGVMVINKTLSSSAGCFYVYSGGTFVCPGTYTLKAISAGANFSTVFEIFAGGILRTGSPQGITSAGAGSIQTNYRSYSPGANYSYVGTQAQVTGLDAMAVNNLSIDNFYPVTLSNRLSVAGTVTMYYYCSINTSSAAMLILNNGAIFNNNGGTFASGAGYVNGPMQKAGAQAFVFPVGSSATAATPIAISAPPSVTDTFQAQYVHSSAAALGTVTAINLSHVSPCDYWGLNYHGPASPAINITAYWNNYNAACNNITSLPLMVLAHLQPALRTSSWSTYARSVVTGSTTNGSVTWNSATVFGTFALGVTFSAARQIAAENIVNSSAGTTAWPIPSTGLIHISGGTDANAAVSAKITNAAGQLLQTISLLNKTEATTTLSQNGVYFITLINKDGSIRETKRMVIAH